MESGDPTFPNCRPLTFGAGWFSVVGDLFSVLEDLEKHPGSLSTRSQL